MNSCGWRGQALALLIIVLLYLVFDGSSGSSVPSFQKLDHAVELEDLSWNVLNASSYGDFDPAAGKWLNITGFRQSKGWNWEILPEVQARAREMAVSAVGRAMVEDQINVKLPSEENLQFYHNTSSHIKGPWRRSKIQAHPSETIIDMTVAADDKKSKPYYHNITGEHGTIILSIKENGNSTSWQDLNARGLHARMNIIDDSSDVSSVLNLQGIHLLETGSIVLITHTAELAGLFGLPHLALSSRQFSTYKNRLNQTLKSTIEAQASHRLTNTDPWSAKSQSERQECEIAAYLQQYSLTQSLGVSMIEQELRTPQGRLLKIEDMHMTMTLFSPNCGYVLESYHDPSIGPSAAGHLVGMKIEVFENKAKNHFQVFATIILFQMLNLMRQIKDASTPSTKSRISRHTMLMLVAADLTTTLTMICMISMSDAMVMIMASVAFMANMCGVHFNLKFLGSIWTIQHEEAISQRRQQAQESTERPALQPHIPIVTAAGVDSLPLPVTSGPAAQLLGSDGLDMSNFESIPQDPQSQLYYTIGFGTISLWLVSIWMTSWSSTVVRLFFFCLSLIYVSCWIPQIFRNAVRNCRQALRWDFVVVQSILRLFPLLYFYAFDGNLFDVKTDLTKSVVLISIVWIQICILALQNVFDPRLPVPKSWLPPAYDYHPILKEDDESTRVILGHFDSASTTSSKTASTSHNHDEAKSKDPGFMRHFDCAICMQTVEVPVIPNSSITSEGRNESISQSAFLWRRKYMVTPCRHVFHSQCLESAMKYRLQCPICREGLPVS